MRTALSGCAAVMLLAVALAGCASPADTPTASSASPTPTCAVAAQPGVEPPAGCVVYDPEQNMASNETYRERMAQPEAGRIAGEALLEPVTTALTGLRSSGAALTDDAVRAALAAAGVAEEHIQTTGSEGAIAFGAAVAGGGCIFGGVTAEAATVEVGGYIMDGGCLAMVGH